MRNPVRRNKNIGKTQGGRVISGRAYEKFSRNDFQNCIYAQLSESGERWQLFCENPSRDYFHPCEGFEYIEVLNKLPEELTKHLDAIILPRISKVDAKRGVEARKWYGCIIINPFPVNMEMVWQQRPVQSTYRHYEPWCNRWHQKKGNFYLKWNIDELKRYYLYHLFLHELGHINQPWFHSLNRREEFAENFALEWAKKLGEI
jgi:hypothetical protein